MSSVVLTGGTVIELDPPRITQKDVVIEHGRIAAAGTSASDPAVIDCAGCLVMPGLVVAHTHLYSALARGMPPPLDPTPTFRAILEQIWWRLDVALDHAALFASARVGALEALKAGATTILDHHESPRCIVGSLEALAKGVEQVGARALLAYGATDREGAAGARAGLKESERFVAAPKGSRIRGAIGLHAPFTCSDPTLAEAAELATATGAWLHFHAAEGPDDRVWAARRASGKLIAELDALGLIGPRTLLAHAVDIDAEQAGLLAARDAWISHQPRSNMNNGVGYAAQLGGLPRVALGTDGIDNDPFAELRAAFFRRREHTGPGSFFDPVEALVRGHRLARAVFDEPLLGTLAPGAPGDLIVLDHDPPARLEASCLAGHLLFGDLTSARVRDVLVAGQVVVRQRRSSLVDEHEMAAEARTEAARVFSRL